MKTLTVIAVFAAAFAFFLYGALYATDPRPHVSSSLCSPGAGPGPLVAWHIDVDCKKRFWE